MPLTFESFDWIINWVQQPTWKLVALLFVNGFWIVAVWWLLKEVWEAFQFWTSGMWSQQTRGFVYLAVDVPALTEQTPLSMEAIFNQLAGAHGTSTWVEEKWGGEFQDWFSFEIVSLEGYVQYIIRCPEANRDLVEAAVYAQYPDAEISEVSDYTQDIPSQWPNEKYNFIGTGYMLNKPDGYPIKTYNEFEDKIRGELVDPMAALLEIMSKIGKGEQIWYQVLAKPIVDKEWIPAAQDEIDKLIDRYEAPVRGGILGFLMGIPHLITSMIDSVADTQFTQTSSESGSPEDIARSPMFKLTPGERTLLEDMERKTGKLAYKCYLRVMYVGKHDVYSPSKGFGPVIGALKQFNDASKNWFNVTKGSWTKANYFFKKARIYQRQNSFYEAYANRSIYASDAPSGFVLNSEELATIYHFPMASVKAPLVKRTGAKKSEPPTSLPLGDIGGLSMEIVDASEPPGQLPSEPVNPTLAKLSGSSPVSAKKTTANAPIPDESAVRYVEIPDEPET